jgi:hypothetical protein
MMNPVAAVIKLCAVRSSELLSPAAGDKNFAFARLEKIKHFLGQTLSRR